VYADVDLKNNKKKPVPTPPGTTPQDGEKVVY